MLSEREPLNKSDYEVVLNSVSVAAYEFMPPVIDEEAETVTFYCSKCLQIKTSPTDVTLTYSVSTTMGSSTGWSGWICPDCDKV